MKGRGLVLHKPTMSRAALSLTTAGHRDRTGGFWQGPADIRSPRDLPAEKCCLGPYPWGVRDLAQAWLVAVWVLNLDWVLY